MSTCTSKYIFFNILKYVFLVVGASTPKSQSISTLKAAIKKEMMNNKKLAVLLNYILYHRNGKKKFRVSKMQEKP
jgi:hypothetical protein